MTEPSSGNAPASGWTSVDRDILYGIARSLSSIATSAFWIAAITIVSAIAGFIAFVIASSG